MKEILKSKKFIIPSVVIAIAYILLVTYLMNFRLTKDTLLGDYPLSYKWNIMVALLQGLGTSMTKVALVLLILTAILTGVNFTLVKLRLSALRKGGKLHFMVGGSSFIAIVTSGCAMCGLPILGLLGLSGSLIYLPFQGTELSVIAVILLLITLYFMLVSYPTEQVCKIINKPYEK
jgi:hypothetical protein